VSTQARTELEEFLGRKVHLFLQVKEEIANAVSFLCSDKAAYITGETLHVNGGMYMG
jgi:NAD(P)-dependent dehydrogenase (short-subunit alcohol dehydrogenase family)